MILDIIYFFALLAAGPFLLFRMFRYGRYRHNWLQRFGRTPERHGLQPVIWLHGVSLGEINASRTLVAELQSQLPDYRVVISSTTDTGMAAAEKAYSPFLTVFQWPLDFTWAVRRAIRRTQPALVILMEGEIWPNFLAECNRRKIPAVVVNGRMSPNKGYPRYKKLGLLAAALFNRLTAIGVQDEIYGHKFIELGGEPSKVHLTGMLKYDTIQVADSVPGQEIIASQLALDTRAGKLLVAGGTGPGEEQILLEALGKKITGGELTLLIVPRKPERFDEVARLITKAGFPCIRRSGHNTHATQLQNLPQRAVILGDTMGELRKFYGLSDMIFVGRSLVHMGGSDMIEAAALGKPVCFGPHTFNFPQADDLVRHGCVRVANGDALRQCVAGWLADGAATAKAAAETQRYIRSQQGATKRNVELVCHVLHRVPAVLAGDIATDELE
ncbi:MAG TPA: 3-deoxy-D-manno-octulosonic acid transferase [Phycisphaerae bacterium]|nr:3-deoxy-D-manno-octulosonic acid transferase [Phycisphaerae bacterium]